MTKLLDRAIEYARELPAEMQDEVAGILLRFMGEDGGEDAYELTPEEKTSFAKSLAQARARHFAPDDEVKALFSKYAP